MRGSTNIIVSSRSEKCSDHKGSKHFKKEHFQTMPKSLSEYQAAFKLWPYQPTRQSLKPDQRKVSKNQTAMERKTTYGFDFVSQASPKKMLPKKHKSELTFPKTEMATDTTYSVAYIAKTNDPPKLSNPALEQTDDIINHSPHKPFQGDSIYTASYPSYDKLVIAECQQHPIKKHDNIEIPPSNEAERYPQSTAQGDFVHHGYVERPVPIRPKSNNGRAKDPLDVRTEYKDFYTSKTSNPQLCKIGVRVRSKSEKPKFQALSTAMADFTTPTASERVKPCHPAVSNHFSSAKFQNETTFNQAYKQWPVSGYDLPLWAKKPKYKRPTGGMITNSLYMHDFTDPKMITPPTPIVPSSGKTPIIKQDVGDTKYEYKTTYNKDFREWEDIEPPESYRIVEVYKPPKQHMVCETIQRADFKGEPTPRVKPCRQVSQHRDLNTSTYMTFVTTYNENFTSPRPKSSPSTNTMAAVPVKPRSNSATPHHTPVPPRLVQNIPRPDLSMTPRSATQADMCPEGCHKKCAKCTKLKMKCICANEE